MEGTRITIAKAPAEPDRAPATTDVLVVDDELDARDTIAELLEAEGFSVRRAANGAEALAMLRDGRPAIVLLDLRMPVMDGWEFCDRISRDAALRDVPVAVVSAIAPPPGLPGRAVDAGLFLKPVNLSRLVETVRRWAGR